MAYAFSRESLLAVGELSCIAIPSVCKTVRTLPSWHVCLPFSSSIMNRNPVPHVMAKSFWVTPKLLRVLLTTWPICSGVHFTIHPYVTER
jgi:hypothetical protein